MRAMHATDELGRLMGVHSCRSDEERPGAARAQHRDRAAVRERGLRYTDDHLSLERLV
jgi:hypothetical protein